MRILSLIIILLIMFTLIGSCTQRSSSQLSELQITACNSADEAGTCDTKLPELDLVTNDQCCSILGKCC